MLRRIHLVFLSMILGGVLIGTALAQEEIVPRHEDKTIRHYGLAGMVSFPYDDLGDDQTTGYGIHGMWDYPWIPLLDLTADVGWNHFPGKEDNESVDVWEFTGGMRFVLGSFYMSGEVGYYTKVKSVSFVPGMGLRMGNLDLSFRYRAAKSTSWTGIRVGYFF